MEVNLHRFEATQLILRNAGDRPIVANLGPTSDELWHAEQRDRNFYTYGNMGLCSSIALGMAVSIAIAEVLVAGGLILVFLSKGGRLWPFALPVLK